MAAMEQLVGLAMCSSRLKSDRYGPIHAIEE